MLYAERDLYPQSNAHRYNIKTGAWDQLDYGTTSNGISFTRALTAGTYSKLEMYYYTNHSCMYNKSNITYTVEYYFE
ncbi:hypothetical protein [Anaerotignum neopropionicum]|uniref:hypothetical protein n=1 Tax=Anaerotignum neopropionicum TaxID=36847 RepID=UPI0012FD1C7B|nr:hypothetical protein [Anaerotignum neopropionicum]